MYVHVCISNMRGSNTLKMASAKKHHGVDMRETGVHNMRVFPAAPKEWGDDDVPSL